MPLREEAADDLPLPLREEDADEPPLPFREEDADEPPLPFREEAADEPSVSSGEGKDAEKLSASCPLEEAAEKSSNRFPAGTSDFRSFCEG